MKKLTKRGESLVLKVVGPNGESHNGFIWPLEVGAVVEAHRRGGLPPNPLYLRGARRVGCFPCIYAQKHDVALLAAEDPDRAASVRAMEAALSAAARVKAVQAGCDPREQRHERTFFGPGEKGRGWDSYGIDAHLRWATTDGKRAKAVNLEAVAADARQRWGIE